MASSEDNRAYHVDIKSLLDKHSLVFGDIPRGRSLDRGFEHVIELEGAKLVITTPYRPPQRHGEIEKAIRELLYIGHIRPSSSPFASSVVLVTKNDETMKMCID